jgi:heme/copper-type cytochrome/quinol oxidase subunit 3
MFDNKSMSLKLLKEKERHHFHLVDNSQLPVVTAFTAFLLVLSFVFYWHPTDILGLHKMDNIFIQFAWLEFSFVIFCWFCTVVFESARGHHTSVVRKGLRLGMLLFIISEIMFFFAFFWAFFHVSLSPAVAIGCVWPPQSIQPLDVWGLPLVNTILLLSSGVTITFAHRAILSGDSYTKMLTFIKFLLITIILGFVFLCCQYVEYKYGITFSWKENIYGSTFFITTGFHGLHVTIGTIFLLFCLIRAVLTSSKLLQNCDIVNCDYWSKIRFFFENKNKFPSIVQMVPLVPMTISDFSFRKEQHLGFEASAWYWHFVDVVWIFLFITVYWWGS